MPAIDLAQIEQLGGLDNEELAEILRDFLDQLGAQTAELVALLRSGERDGFRESSHRLKGGARMAAFPEIGDLAETWERNARQDDPLPDPAELREQLEAAVARARQAFDSAIEAQRS